jgi:hypothetical protein
MFAKPAWRCQQERRCNRTAECEDDKVILSERKNKQDRSTSFKTNKTSEKDIQKAETYLKLLKLVPIKA